ncbi:MAG TPA: NUDIX hydrolase N-terminal domain-containing protein [Stellaceae bacterium]|nr:NUDIX hydrolase N-terminal domain-containing protein [Stellaceae bacterium]
MNSEPPVLALLRELAALAGTGLGFTSDPYDRERYQRIAELSHLLVAERLEVTAAAVAAALDHEPGYVTPKVDVRGAVIADGKVLLVRERSDGRWALPGGYADVNLAPSEAVEAEIVQESGYQAKAVKLVAALDRRRHHHAHPLLLHCYKLFFLCRLEGGEAAVGLETTEVGFFPEDALPDLSLGRCTPEQIRLCFEHARRPELPTVFD